MRSPRPEESDVAVGSVCFVNKIDFERFSARDIDPNRGGSSRELVVDDRAGHHPGAASKGLVLDATLVGADRNVSAFENLDEVHIGSRRREMLMISCRRTEPGDVDSGDIEGLTDTDDYLAAKWVT